MITMDAARKLSIYGVFSCLHLISVFSLNKGKHGPEKTLYLDYFYTLHKSIEDWIHKDWRVSDQISIAQIQMKPRNESEIKSNTKIMKKKMAPKYTTKRKSKDATTIKVVQVKSTL